jgi:hypothetical protein
MIEIGFLQGASCLLDWAEWSGALENRRVLELGSGLGQVSTIKDIYAWDFRKRNIKMWKPLTVADV